MEQQLNSLEVTANLVTGTQEKNGDGVNKIRPYICKGCKTELTDMTILKAGASFWHQECLVCHDCTQILEQRCFFRDGMVLCADDFFRRFGPVCSGCSKTILASEVVRKINSRIYHLACLCCMNCKKQLETGDQFYMLEDGKVICKDDYVEKTKSANDNAGQEKKRARTFINTSQLSRLMHAYYNMPKPNLIERQRIATEIGLDMRVVQVWFQNRRAKDRRNVNKPLHPMLQQAANRRKKHARSNTWSAGMSRDMEFDKDDDACSDYGDIYHSREDLKNASQPASSWNPSAKLDDGSSPSAFTKNKPFDSHAPPTISISPTNDLNFSISDVRTVTSVAPQNIQGMDSNRFNLPNGIDNFAMVNDSRMIGDSYSQTFPYWNSYLNTMAGNPAAYIDSTIATMTSHYFQSPMRSPMRSAVGISPCYEDAYQGTGIGINKYQ